jgi:hypothetical protein
MDNSSWIPPLSTAVLVAILSPQNAGLAAGLESSMETIVPAQRLDKLSEGQDRDQARIRAVRTRASSNPDADTVRDPGLAEYLELHSRAVDESVHSLMARWSTLQQLAN